MTEVYITKDKTRYKLKAYNHAGTNEVCAGVSAIIYALEGALFNNDYAADHVSTLEPGHAEIEAICSDHTAAEDFRMAAIGLMQIQKAHPDEIGISQNIL